MFVSHGVQFSVRLLNERNRYRMPRITGETDKAFIDVGISCRTEYPVLRYDLEISLPEHKEKEDDPEQMPDSNEHPQTLLLLGGILRIVAGNGS